MRLGLILNSLPSPVGSGKSWYRIPQPSLSLCVQKLPLRDTAVTAAEAAFRPQHLKCGASLMTHTPSTQVCAHVLVPGRAPSPLLAHSPGCPVVLTGGGRVALCIPFLYFQVAGLWFLLSECCLNK